MYKYEKLIDDLIALMNSVSLDPERAKDLVPRYHNACESANERLYECEAMIRKGYRSEAIQLASQEPDLLDMVGLLAFPERGDYLEWLLNVVKYDTMPPDLRVETARELGRQIAEELSLADLLRKHRLLALGRGPLEARLTILRQIQARDPASPAWGADITALEKARMREISEDIDEVEMSGNPDLVDELLRELDGVSWTVPVPDGYRSRLQTIQARQEAEVLNAELKEIAEGISQAWSNLDFEAGKQYRVRWNKLIGLASLPDDSPIVQMANDALLWLTEEDQRLAEEARRQLEQEEAEARRIREQEEAEAKRVRDEKEAEAKRIQDEKEAEARRIREEKERQAAAGRKRKSLFRWTLVLLLLGAVGAAAMFIMNSQKQRAANVKAVEKAEFHAGRHEYQKLVQWYDEYIKTTPAFADNLDIRRSVDDARAILAEFQRLLEKARGDGNPENFDLDALDRIETLVEEKFLSPQQSGLVNELRQQSDKFHEGDRIRMSREYTAELEKIKDKVALFRVGTDVTSVKIADTSKQLTELLQEYNALPDARRRAAETRQELVELEEEWKVKEEIEDLYQTSSSTLVGDNDAFTAKLGSFARKHQDDVIAQDLQLVIKDQQVVEGLIRWGDYYADALFDDLSKVSPEEAGQLLGKGRSLVQQFGRSPRVTQFNDHATYLSCIVERARTKPQEGVLRLCLTPVFERTEFLIWKMDGTRYYLPVALTEAQLEKSSISFQAFGDLTATLEDFDIDKDDIRFYGKAPQREIIRKIWEIVESGGLQANWDEAFLQMFKIALQENPPEVNQITGRSEQTDVTDPLWRTTVLNRLHRAASEGSAVIAQAFAENRITADLFQDFLGVDWVDPEGMTADKLRPTAKKVIVAALLDRIGKVETAMGDARMQFLEAGECRVSWIGMLGKTPADQWKVYLSPQGKKIKEAGTLLVTYSYSTTSQAVVEVGTLDAGVAVLENEDAGIIFKIGRPVFFQLKQ